MPLTRVTFCAAYVPPADDLDRGAGTFFPLLHHQIADAQERRAGDNEQGGVGEREPEAHGGVGPADHDVTNR